VGRPPVTGPSVALWAAAAAGCAAATALAWGTRAAAGLLAAGLSAGGLVAAAAMWAPQPDGLAFAAAFAAVSIVATALGAAVGRLLDDDGGG
jgi:hypothetical protein